MSSAASSSTALLPNKNEELGFRRLVFDRMRAFMVMELFRVREALFCSDTLIRKTKTEEAPLNTIFCDEKHLMFIVFGRFERYVVDTSYGDAALRWAGHLPPVATFAPGQSLFKCGCCEEGGHTQIASMMDKFNSLEKVDYTEFLDFFEAEYTKKGVVGAQSVALRRGLEREMASLHHEFSRMTEMLLRDMDYPYHELGAVSDEADFYKFVEEVEPLPPSLAEGMCAMDPLAYSIGQLEQLRSRGQTLRNKITRLRREEGNAFWADAASAPNFTLGQLAQCAAENKWFSVGLSGGMESAAAQANLGALYLKREDYEKAFRVAGSAAAECKFFLAEPAHYKDWRRASVTAYSTGRSPETPVEARRSVTHEQYVACRKLEWKSSARALKAHWHVSLDAIKAKDFPWAQLQRKFAHLDYRMMMEIDDAPPPPTKEHEQFEELYRKRMEAAGQPVLDPLA